MELYEAQELLSTSVARLVVEEWDLAVVDANERTIACHLSRLITNSHHPAIPIGIRVDNDYNRHLLDRKRAWLDEPTGLVHRAIEPDIVLHRRGLVDDNLLAIEAKKAFECSPHDERKIRSLLLEPYDYRFGVLLALGITPAKDQSSWQPSWRWLTREGADTGHSPLFLDEEVAMLNDQGQQLWQERLW